MDSFASSALIGHLVSIRVLTTLAVKQVISSQDVRDVADECLYDLERFQELFPEDREAFEEARRFLDGYARFPETN